MLNSASNAIYKYICTRDLSILFLFLCNGTRRIISYSNMCMLEEIKGVDFKTVPPNSTMIHVWGDYSFTAMY